MVYEPDLGCSPVILKLASFYCITQRKKVMDTVLCTFCYKPRTVFHLHLHLPVRLQRAFVLLNMPHSTETRYFCLEIYYTYSKYGKIRETPFKASKDT